MKQSLLSCAVALLAFTVCFASIRPVYAQVLAVSTEKGPPKDVVTITATLETKRAKVSALQGDIHFDPKKFLLQGCALSRCWGQIARDESDQAGAGAIHCVRLQSDSSA